MGGANRSSKWGARLGATAAAVLGLVGCERPDSTKQAPATSATSATNATGFHCERVPSQQGIRQCEVKRATCERTVARGGLGGGCFEQPHAWCYMRSIRSERSDEWERRALSACYAAVDECQRDRDTWRRYKAPPPILTECREVGPTEVVPGE